MPWIIYDPKQIDKQTSRKMFCTTYSSALDVVELRPMLNAWNGVTGDKPTDVPDGMALRFFPTSDDVYLAKEWLDARLRRREISLVPWQDVEALCDTPRPKWAAVRHMTELYMPYIIDGQLEYFASYTHMQERRRTTTTIGRFLQTLWSNYDEAFDGWMTRTYGSLTDDIIRMWSEVPKAQTPADVQFATTEDEIDFVYANGPSSCMGGKPPEGYWQTGINPVRAYAGGDLAVAWLPKRRDPSKPSQRAMCWPEKKIYSRIYGTGPLEQFLKSLGYTVGHFHGAKLKKIVLNDNQVVLPYIDYHNYVVERRDHLRIFHKSVKHPWKPTVEVTTEPRTQRATWPATATTSGFVMINKCRGCKKITTHRDYGWTGDSTLCKSCSIHSVSCMHCQKIINSRKDPTLVWVLSTDDLQQVSTLKQIHKRKRSTSALCHTCADFSHLKRDYRSAGYVWISNTTGQPVDLTTWPPR
jgi:hypothetical protein